MKKAIFDNNLRLVGAAELEAVDESAIDPGDLPLDGSYRWDKDKQTFLPVGFKFGKPVNNTEQLARMVYHMANAIVNGEALSPDLVRWVKENRGFFE